MKLFLISLLTSQFVFAQNVGVNVDGVNASENTTIEIKKGANATTSNGPLFQITEGNEVVEGDGALLIKDAKKNWKQACNDWKKEFRELNKDNSILSMNCGQQNCATQSGETICTSKANYKLKVKIN